MSNPWELILWYTNRRWVLKRFAKGYAVRYRIRLYERIIDCNMGGCCKSTVIRNDLRQILLGVK